MMRIWSVHPEYLDTKGLVALWRESLLAKHVLEDRTKGYKYHPQLMRFRGCKFPTDAINCYLHEVYKEAKKRNYNFNSALFDPDYKKVRIKVTAGQMEYERKHLLSKLKIRDRLKFNELRKIRQFRPHPLFTVTQGGIEEFEVLPSG